MDHTDDLKERLRTLGLSLVLIDRKLTYEFN